MAHQITIPADLLPGDGRFGSGPSKVSDAQLQALMAAQPGVLGTSHRQAPVKNVVGDIRSMLAELFTIPSGYEVVLANGGASFFWDAAAFGLIERRSQHCVHGEFGGKFAAAVDAAPHLDAPRVIEALPGAVAIPQVEDGVDVYAWAHNETSTGAMAPVTRVDADALTVVDGTSAAGGVLLDLSQTDVYYFSPQKNFASDGGLWWAVMSPAAIERIERLASSGRYIPESLSLAGAVTNSRANQTMNTPAVATLVMMRAHLEWLMGQGGLQFADARTRESSTVLYQWADAHPLLTPFVQELHFRSQVVATIDVDGAVDSAQVREVAKAHGIVDIDPYRKLGRNQLRVGVFPAVEPEDVRQLTKSLDVILEALSTSV